MIGKLYKYTIFGPTCYSIDTISKTCMLPDLAIGEWVYVENFVNPHGDVYSGGKRSIFDFLVLKSITK